MRSTVDILDPLDSELRGRAQKLGISYKEALNRVVAAGLKELEGADVRRHKKRYRVHARACGFKAGVDLQHLNRIADVLGDEEDFG